MGQSQVSPRWKLDTAFYKNTLFRPALMCPYRIITSEN